MSSYRSPPLSVLAVLAALAGGCSSGRGAASGNSAAPPGSADTTTAPADAQTPSADQGMLPCDPAKTFPPGWAFGSDGDERCLLAPDPSQGTQFHYGPTNYNDATEVEKYTLAASGEVTDCIFLYTPNDATVYFNAYHVRMRPGSHHMLLYIEPQGQSGPSLGGNGGISLGTSMFAPTGSNGPSACNQPAASRNLFGAQTATLDVAGITPGPENEGLAVQIPGKQQAAMQAHFINATSKPILREVWANLGYVDKSKVTQVGDPIFFLGGLNMNIPMGVSQAIKGTAAVPQGVASDFRLVIGTGHYHAHTTEFKAWTTIGGVRQQIIQEYNTLDHPPEPGTWSFTSAQKNPVIDPANKAAGAYSGTLYMKVGDSIDWECDVTNNDVSSSSPPQFNAPSIKFANAVFTGEMCNMFGMYVPSTGQPWSAYNF
jgi:hypothetical protein